MSIDHDYSLRWGSQSMATGLWGNPYGTFLLKLNSSFWSFSCSEAGVWPRFHRYLSMVRMATWRVFITCQWPALVSVAAVSPPSADVCSGHHRPRCRCLYTCWHCLWFAAFRQPKTFYSSSTRISMYVHICQRTFYPSEYLLGQMLLFLLFVVIKKL